MTGWKGSVGAILCRRIIQRQWPYTERPATPADRQTIEARGGRRVATPWVAASKMTGARRVFGKAEGGTRHRDFRLLA